VNKRSIAEIVAEENSITKEAAKKIVQSMIDAMSDMIVEGGLEIRGLGSFSHVARAARQARNPSTGKPVSVPEKLSIRFKPSPFLLGKIADVEADRKRAEGRDGGSNSSEIEGGGSG